MSFKTLCSSVARMRTRNTPRKAAIAFAALSLSTGCIEKPGVGRDNDFQDSGVDAFVLPDARPRTHDARPETQDSTPDTANSAQDTGHATRDTFVPNTGIPDMNAPNAQPDAGIPIIREELNGRMLLNETIKAALNDRGDLAVNEDGTCNESFVVPARYLFSTPETSGLAHPFSNGMEGSLVEGVTEKLFKMDTTTYSLLADQEVTDPSGVTMGASQTIFIGGYSGINVQEPMLLLSPLIYSIKFLGNEDAGLHFNDAGGNDVSIPLTLAGREGTITGFHYPQSGNHETTVEVFRGGNVQFTYSDQEGEHTVDLQDGHKVRIDGQFGRGEVVLGWRMYNDLPCLRSISIYEGDGDGNDTGRLLPMMPDSYVALGGFGLLQFYFKGLEAENGYDLLQVRGVNDGNSFEVQTQNGIEQVRADTYMRITSQVDNTFVTPQGSGNILIVPLGYSIDDMSVGARSLLLKSSVDNSYVAIAPNDDAHNTITYGIRYTSLGPYGPARPAHLKSNVLIVSKNSGEAQTFNLAAFMMLEDSALSNTPSQGSVDVLFATFMQGSPQLMGQYAEDGNSILYVSPFATDHLHLNVLCGIDQSGNGGRVMGQGEYTHRGSLVRTLDRLNLDVEIPILEPAQIIFGLRLSE